ncbi:MAG: hypothetical protein QOH91_628 [Mycobacterium sp.]|jgi:hypothetical protein|nr:hypothetical protein [Mycobacterium sp.]
MSNNYTRAERAQLASTLGCSVEHLDERLSGFVDAAKKSTYE